VVAGREEIVTGGIDTRDGASPRWRALAPPLGALFFLLHPLLSLLRAAAQLQDPSTGVHLATGRYILATGIIPHQDLFSFTAAGQPWVATSWLFDVGAALLDRIGGLPLFATVCMLVYAAVPLLLYRRMLRMGATLLVALVLTFAAWLVLMTHALARPDVVTYALFAFFLGRIDDVRTGRRPAASLGLLPPLAALWANLHGGFVLALALAGVYAGVAAVRTLVTGDPRERRDAVTFTVLLAALTLATALNPRGFGLHLELVRHVSAGVGTFVNEWHSPDFQAPTVPIQLFELLLLAVILVGAVARERLAWVEITLLVVFLHQALHEARHVVLFAIVAAPLLARELSVELAGRWPTLAARWRRVAEEQDAQRSSMLYVPGISALFLALAVTGATGFPATFDDLQLSRGAAAFIGAHKERFARPFNTDNLAGPLIYGFWPDVRVFVDDRTDVYGAFVADDYVPVLTARPGWRDVFARYDIDSAVVAAATPCAALLRAAPDWEVAFEDGQNVIFLRRAS
jgi:hypothetical protein